MSSVPDQSTSDRFLCSPKDLVKDSELHISFRASQGGSTTDLVCRILEVYEPSMSVVLHVSIVPDLASRINLPHNAIVKLYNRRFMVSLREEYGLGTPWSLAKEREYQRYLQKGTRTADVSLPSYPVDWEQQGEKERNHGEFEAWIQQEAITSFHAEKDTYARLHEMQGISLPRMYGTVDIKIQNPLDNLPGIIIEYISSMKFDHLIETWKNREPQLPNSLLVSLCYDAIRIVDRVSDFDVLNPDVRLDQFLLRPSFASITSPSQEESSSRESMVVLIDLGGCRFRRAGESDEEWREAKQMQDETGAVGYGVAGLIKHHICHDLFTYTRGQRWYL